MKQILFFIGMVLFSLKIFATVNIDKIDPPFWYAGMKNPELQLFIYGNNIGDASVSVNYPGISLSQLFKHHM